MPLLKFDPEKVAVLNPSDYVEKPDKMPETLVSFFEQSLMNYFLKNFKGEIIGYVGNTRHRDPIYRINFGGKDLAIVQANVGAPYCTICFEEICAMGAKNILLFGSCGALTHVPSNSLIIPMRAYRDEGTSYHYKEPSEYIDLNKKYVNRIKKFFDTKGVPYEVGSTWTTDGFYRETSNKVEEMLSKGCISVEMECASIAAMAEFRGYNFAQFLYTSDSLADSTYQIGNITNPDVTGQEIALHLALELATKLFD